ncbi:hypothetical protein [Algoriphagus sp. D3-2-R+10]|nr:hypothetical protein [Algoriphagus sp. D3-2-R+10]
MNLKLSYEIEHDPVPTGTHKGMIIHLARFLPIAIGMANKNQL